MSRFLPLLLLALGLGVLLFWFGLKDSWNEKKHLSTVEMVERVCRGNEKARFKD